MKIKVTKKHIKRGMPHEIGNCPIALALTDGVPDASYAVVTYGNFIVYRNSDDDVVGALPNKIANFISKFDNGKPVEPIEFTINLPDERKAR